MTGLPWRTWHCGGILSRRAWLLGSVIGGLSLVARGEGIGPDPDPSAGELARVLARAKVVKLGGFRTSETEHYLGVGDAPDSYREQALRICKALGTAYQAHFREKGFAVKFPARRLTVVALKDRNSYGAFLGEVPGANDGGHYDLETNCLVIFDFRPGGAELAATAERVNTFTLVHESLHQLTFNTGLLDRRADVPLCISEGLAAYGEHWQASARHATLGQVNKPWLAVLKYARNRGTGWFPWKRLIAEDDLFDQDATEQLARAQAWLLVHYLMKVPSRAAEFRAYLETIRGRRDPGQRVEDLRTHLDGRGQLDRELTRWAAQLR